ncbi:LCP family protein [Amnibacterium sp. CER49]|uniref:LCP family protein n=1 Tax=Amnibacterium sp. CER49 TaxID=3039161 RepID=UPI00244A1F9F|nr:LCP family protein [Amnibacterium sp. CER49]MDH2442370.1 LCP family protein [Amnibacterium sp. CER49]
MGRRLDAPVLAGERHRARSRRDDLRVPLAALRIAGVVVIVLAISAASIAGITAWRLSHELASRAVDLGGRAAPAALSGGFDVLIVGVDNAPGQSSWGAARQATMNDVDIVVHIAADHRSGVVLSIPRDLVIDQPACPDPRSKQVAAAVQQMPLNTAFSRGGLGCVARTVAHLTGLTIPYAAQFSFQGTVAMADAVGGVPVCVDHAIHDPYSGLDLPAGRSVITGRTALAYLRNRHGVGDGSDLARISSQQAYMSALMRKMTSSSTLTSPQRLYALASTAATAVTLSTSMARIDTLVSMLLAVKGIPTSQMVFVQFPTEPDPANPNKVVPAAALASALLHRVQTDQPVRLAASTRGYSTTVKAPRSTPSAAPRSTQGSSAAPSGPAPTASPKRAGSALSGLNGQTAAQQTCSRSSSG